MEEFWLDEQIDSALADPLMQLMLNEGTTDLDEIEGMVELQLGIRRQAELNRECYEAQPEQKYADPSACSEMLQRRIERAAKMYKMRIQQGSLSEPDALKLLVRMNIDISDAWLLLNDAH